MDEGKSPCLMIIWRCTDAIPRDIPKIGSSWKDLGCHRTKFREFNKAQSGTLMNTSTTKYLRQCSRCRSFDNAKRNLAAYTNDLYMPKTY